MNCWQLWFAIFMMTTGGRSQGIFWWTSCGYRFLNPSISFYIYYILLYLLYPSISFHILLYPSISFYIYYILLYHWWCRVYVLAPWKQEIHRIWGYDLRLWYSQRACGLIRWLHSIISNRAYIYIIKISTPWS